MINTSKINENSHNKWNCQTLCAFLHIYLNVNATQHNNLKEECVYEWQLHYLV